jgi:hypothetical protein
VEGRGHVELAGEPPSGLDSSGSRGIAATHVLGIGRKPTKAEAYLRGIFGMNEPTITCPHCNAELRLAASLADPLIRTAREQSEKRIAQKEDAVARRESAIAAQRAELARAVEAIEQQVTSRLKIEREIAAEEAKKAQLSELESKIDQVAQLQRELHERDNRLAEAQKAQAESSRKQRELEDAKRQLDLQIETRVQELRSETKQEAEDALKLNIKDKEEQIASMQRKLQDLDHMYEYLTGPRFRQRLEAIVETFSIMQTNLERERKTMTRLRARRERQIRGMIESTVGMCGDFQAIAGKTLEEIDGLAQIARRVEARRKRGPTNHRVEPINARGRTH